MRIAANGIHLEVEVFGPESAPALVLVRGLGSQLVHWPSDLIEGFATKGFRVITFDNRDVGLSDRCPSPDVDADADAILKRIRRGLPLVQAYRLEDMAADVVGLLDALGVEMAHVFGISMGGAIAQILAAKYVHRVTSAIIVMSSARSISDRALSAEQLSWLLARPMTQSQAEEALIKGVASYGSPAFPETEQDIRTIARAEYQRGYDADGINRQFLASYIATDRREVLGDITCPSLVIHGTDDPLTSVEMASEIAARIAGGEFHVVPGMGHDISRSLAPLMVDLTASFFKRRCST